MNWKNNEFPQVLISSLSNCTSVQIFVTVGTCLQNNSNNYLSAFDYNILSRSHCNKMNESINLFRFSMPWLIQRKRLLLIQIQFVYKCALHEVTLYFLCFTCLSCALHDKQESTSWLKLCQSVWLDAFHCCRSELVELFWNNIPRWKFRCWVICMDWQKWCNLLIFPTQVTFVSLSRALSHGPRSRKVWKFAR